MSAFLHMLNRTVMVYAITAWSAVTVFGQVAPSGEVWENSLGMKFRSVPGFDVRMSIWETRVRDFERFVNATGHDATNRFFYYAETSWYVDDHFWLKPGFDQTPEHPVVGVSWRDAIAFCQWLTSTERSSGKIPGNMIYRLPTDMEWSAAAEGTPNPFSLTNVANYHPNLNSDTYQVTSPVGTFPANPHGFFDMAGNIWEFCRDQAREHLPYRVIRGGCWQNWHERYVGVQARGQCSMDVRITLYGFRVVLVTGDEHGHDEGGVTPAE